MDGGSSQTGTKLSGRTSARSAGLSALWSSFPATCNQAALRRTYKAPALAHTHNLLPPPSCALTLNLRALSAFNTAKNW